MVVVDPVEADHPVVGDVPYDLQVQKGVVDHQVVEQ